MDSDSVTRVDRFSFGSWAAILAGWDLLVWGGRIRNIITNGLDQSPTWSIVASISFTAAAVVVLVLWYTKWRKGVAPADWGRMLVLVMAGAGGLLWAYRGIAIAFADYSAAFVAVHTVLALVSIGLAIAVLRAWRLSR